MSGNGIGLAKEDGGKLLLLAPLVLKTGAVAVNRNPVAETPPPAPAPVAFVQG